MSVIASPPSGYTFQSISLSGLGGYYSYFGISGKQLASEYSAIHMIAQPLFATNKNSTGFLVDPRASSYTITATATYVGNPQSVSTTGTFTVVRPNATLAPISNWEPNQAVQAAQDYLGIATGGTYPNDFGIRILATTSIPQRPDGNGGFAGTFMIMQTVNQTRSYVDAAGVTHSYILDNEVPPASQQVLGQSYPTVQVDLDNFTGTIGSALQSYSQATNSADGPTLTRTGKQGYSWHQNFGDPQIALSTPDAPRVTFPAAAVSISVSSEMYNTYLMYLPDGGGVWTAVAKVQWSWGGKRLSGR